MRTLLAIFLFLSLAGQIAAQSPWSMGVSAQTGFAGRTQTALQGNDFGNSRFVIARQKTLQPVAGAGGWGGYQPFKTLGLRLGVDYVNSGNREHRIDYTESLVTGQQTVSSEINYHLRVHQVQMPLEVVYEPGNGKIRPRISLGVLANAEWYGAIDERSYNAVTLDTERVWTNQNRAVYKFLAVIYQPVVGVGLRFTDRMSVQLRHTWIAPQRFNWVDNPGQQEDSYMTGVYRCGFGTTIYSTETDHNRSTTMQVSYRLF